MTITRMQIIEAVAAALAVLAMSLVLSGCVVERDVAGNVWVYPLGEDPRACGPATSEDTGLRVIGPASKPAGPDPNEYQ
jgi:hypothetical protein